MTTPTMYESGEYLRHNPSWHEQDAPWKAAHIRGLLERNQIQPQSICEVGCGSGEVLRQLWLQNPDVAHHGYDISPQAFEIARKKTAKNLQYACEDATATDRPPTTVAMAIDVFEHVENYFAFLRSMKGLGQYKVFHIPLDLSVQTLVRMTPLLNVRRYVGHIHYFNKPLALLALRETGHEVLDWCYTSSAVELQLPGRMVRLMRGPRRLAYAISPDWAAHWLGGYSMMVLTR